MSRDPRSCSHHQSDCKPEPFTVGIKQFRHSSFNLQPGREWCPSPDPPKPCRSHTMPFYLWGRALVPLSSPRAGCVLSPRPEDLKCEQRHCSDSPKLPSPQCILTACFSWMTEQKMSIPQDLPLHTSHKAEHKKFVPVINLLLCPCRPTSWSFRFPEFILRIFWILLSTSYLSCLPWNSSYLRHKISYHLGKYSYETEVVMVTKKIDLNCIASSVFSAVEWS